LYTKEKSRDNDSWGIFDMAFRRTLDAIAARLLKRRQKLFFSAKGGVESQRVHESVKSSLDNPFVID